MPNELIEIISRVEFSSAESDNLVKYLRGECAHNRPMFYLNDETGELLNPNDSIYKRGCAGSLKNDIQKMPETHFMGGIDRVSASLVPTHKKNRKEIMNAVFSKLLIPYVDLAAQNNLVKNELIEAVSNVINSGQYVLGPEVIKFEKLFAEYVGTKYAVGVGNGTDALFLALKAVNVGKGDEVITAPNSFLASASAIALAGATPVFVDVREDFNLDPELLKRSITKNTRAIIPIHLTGRPADMHTILKIAKNYQLYVIEDAAQAVGAKYHGQRVGSFGTAGCFSLHPLKNLSACGDAGIITTNKESIYRFLINARNHGLSNVNQCKHWSINSRLDALHAATLSVKLKYLDAWTNARRSIAGYYQKHLPTDIQVPIEQSHEYCVYQTFVVQADQRDDLQKFLTKRGVNTKIHYPVPIHLQEAAAYLGYRQGDFPVAERHAQRILSLPVYPDLKKEQLEYVVNVLYEYFEG